MNVFVSKQAHQRALVWRRAVRISKSSCKSKETHGDRARLKVRRMRLRMISTHTTVKQVPDAQPSSENKTR